MDNIIKQNLLDLIKEKKFDDAYRYLWGQYHVMLLSFAESYLKSRELAEEVTSDVLYQIWNKKENFGDIQHLRVYLLTAVRNRCYRQLMKKKKEQELLIYTDELTDDISHDIAIDPERIMIAGELQKLILEVVENLPPRCKLIYKMIREQGKRNKDVAQELNISVNTIDVQLAIAVKKISFAISLYGQ